MKNINRFILTLFVLFGMSACLDPVSLGFGNEWIGLWENENYDIEFFQNGYAVYTTSLKVGDRDKRNFWGKPAVIDGNVFIDGNKVKISKKRRKKLIYQYYEFTIDTPPTDAIDDEGNPYIYIVLDGETLIKTE